MLIELNGEPFELAAETTLSMLIAKMQLEGKRIAIEVNAEIVPRSQHQTYILAASDKVEIVHAIGGG